MAKKKNKPVEEEGGDVGEWIVTFSDCMTLLLCFFVLLLTFSSFDEESLQRFGGAFDFDLHDSVIIDQQNVRDSMIEPPVHINDQAVHGSETPTNELSDDSTSCPKSRWPENTDDTYSDRKIIRIPSDRLFRYGGRNLTRDGQKLLDTIANHIRKIPYRVIISESSSRNEANVRINGLCLGTNRSWAIIDYLTNKQHLPENQFSVSATQLSSRTGSRKKVVEVVLLAQKVFR